MFLNVDFDDKPKPMASSGSPKPQIVETVAVQSKQVDDLVKKIRKKKKAESDKQKALEKRLRQLEANRKKEERRSKNALSKRKKEEALAKKAEETTKRENDLAEEAKKNRQQDELEADIAAQKLAEEKQRVEDAKKKREEDEIKRIRQQELEQQMLAEQNAISEQRQQYILTEKEIYKNLIASHIKAKMVSDLKVTLQIRMAPGGIVIDVKCLKGDEVSCKAAEVAVRKAEPLPVPKDLDVFDEIRTLNLNFDKLIPGGL
jgi:colicin import membrane protein